MPTISVDQAVLRSYVEAGGHVHNLEELERRLPLLGTDVDRCTDEVLDIEIFPDRPDLLSAETLSRGIRSFIHDEAMITHLDAQPATTSMHVDPELAGIRPFVVCAIVRNVHLGSNDEERDASIRRLMDHQEKLHFAVGRGRRRSSIGVHDLDSIRPPFRAVAAPRDRAFVPLASTASMTIDEILEHHPKGTEYAHLLEGMDKVPLLLDANDAVISFPPIINGVQTTVTPTTTSMLVDVTGWDLIAVEACLQLVCLQLSSMGGVVEAVDVHGGAAEGRHPRTSPSHHRLTKERVRLLLGREFSSEDVQRAFRRLGGKVVDESEEAWTIAMPKWRTDLLHEVDLIEDLAIGHGYEDLGDVTPHAPANGTPRSDVHLRRRLRTVAIGLGLTEVQSLTLSNDEDQFERTRWTASSAITRITNPITVDHTILRQHLLPGLLRLLAANRHHDLPQGVFELGTVVRGHVNSTRFAMLVAEAGGGFAASRGRVQALMQALGAKHDELEMVALPDNEGPWLAGRAAKILVGGMWVGCFGELDPRVAHAFDLNVPLNGAEFDLDALDASLPDPV